MVRGGALAVLIIMAGGCEGTPPPSEPKAESELVYRLWEFGRYRYRGVDEERIGEVRTQMDGVVQETRDYGPLIVFPQDAGPNAEAEVFGNESGQTYWVSAEAPLGTFNPGEIIGSTAKLTQFQEFRKTAENARLQIVVTRAVLEALDFNPNFPGEHDCPWFFTRRELRFCRSIMHSTITFRATAVETSGTELFRTSGFVDLFGSYNAFGLTAGTDHDARVRLWDDGDFALRLMDTGTGALLRLVDPIVIDVPLSAVAVGHHFRLSVYATASTRNNRMRESYLSAYFRDPASADGLAYAFTGLERVQTSAVSPPPSEAPSAPPCTGTPNPAAGSIEFEQPDDFAVELPGAEARIFVTRSGGSTGAVSARLTAIDGTALAGSDFPPFSTHVFFADGEAGSRVVRLPILGDQIAESVETLTLSLSEPSGCVTLGQRTTTTLTIFDDDQGAPPTYTVGGSVTGLAGTGLVIEEVTTGKRLTPGNGPFTFDHQFPDASSYQVRVAAQPTGPVQTCSILRGQGTISGASVTDVGVECVTSPPTFGLDPGFGNAGLVTEGLPGGANALALQHDGKIVAIGGTTLVRFNADGSPDPSLGGTGSVPLGWNGGPSDEAHDVAVQPDGKIVVVGTTRVGTKSHLVAARYLANGQPDSGFGTAGKTTIDPYAAVAGSHVHRAHKVLLQPDGKIVLAGSASVLESGTVRNNFAVARLLASGAPDLGFGGDGATTVDVGGIVDFAYAVALQSDGKLVLTGRAGDNDHVDVGLARVGSDGELDEDYGRTLTGTVLSDLSGDWDEAADMAILPDDSVLVVSQSILLSGSTFGFTLAKYSSDGQLAGLVQTPIGSLHDFSRALALQADGRILVAGQASSGTVNDFAVVRYNADLTLDTTFGEGGVWTLDFFGASDGATDLVVQPDGKVVVGGVVRNGSSNVLGLVRLNP